MNDTLLLPQSVLVFRLNTQYMPLHALPNIFCPFPVPPTVVLQYDIRNDIMKYPIYLQVPKQYLLANIGQFMLQILISIFMLFVLLSI